MNYYKLNFINFRNTFVFLDNSLLLNKMYNNGLRRPMFHIMSEFSTVSKINKEVTHKTEQTFLKIVEIVLTLVVQILLLR